MAFGKSLIQKSSIWGVTIPVGCVNGAALNLMAKNNPSVTVLFTFEEKAGVS